MTSIQMPQLGETIVEGTILKWLKAEGDSVERDEPLFEISTDKVDTEVPSPVAGTLSKIIVAEGETVPVGTELAEVTGDGEEASSDEEPAPAAATAASSAPSASESGGGSGGDGAGEGASDASAAPASAGASASAPAAAGALQDRGPRSQILSPLVRRLAQEHGIDLGTVAGTGTGGRITKADVMAVVASGGAGTGPASEAAAAPPSAPATAAPPSVGAAAAEGETSEPMSHIRRAIAVPHARVGQRDREGLDDGRGQRRPPREAPGAGQGRVPRDARGEAHVPPVRRPGHGRRPEGLPARQRHGSPATTSSRPARCTWASP